MAVSLRQAWGDVLVNINLPPTLTAQYDAITHGWDDYENYGTGIVSIQFGGCDVLEIRVEKNGERFENNGSHYGSDNTAEENLSEFVAEWLQKIFQNALEHG